MNKLLLFSRKSCQPCKMVKQQLEHFNVPHEYIDAEENPELAGQYMVMSTPIMVYLVDEKEADRALGGDACIAFFQKYKDTL